MTQLPSAKTVGKSLKIWRMNLGKKGWLSLFWPKEYGGESWPLVDYLIFLEELARRGSPGYNAIGVKMLAPTLFKYRTEEQKERHFKLLLLTC